jgi:hypothetical protein
MKAALVAGLLLPLATAADPRSPERGSSFVQL